MTHKEAATTDSPVASERADGSLGEAGDGRLRMSPLGRYREEP